jgi:predicted DsbA family dithiol-disulfide isomerase
MDRQAYMRAKFGDDPMKIVEMHKLIAAEGAKDGIEFDFAAIARRPDTLDSHRLIRWAEGQWRAGRSGGAAVHRLFREWRGYRRYPRAGRHRRPVRHGRRGSGEMLEGDTDRAWSNAKDQIAHEMGVTGVPAMIFRRQAGGIGRARCRKCWRW